MQFKQLNIGEFFLVGDISFARKENDESAKSIILFCNNDTFKFFQQQI